MEFINDYRELVSYKLSNRIKNDSQFGRTNRKKGILARAFALACISGLRAQELESFKPTLSFKVGVPVTSMFTTGNPSTASLAAGQGLANYNLLTNSPYTSAVPRYEFGVGAEFHMPYHLRFEVDGLVKRGGFNSQTGGIYRPTDFTQWEVSGVFKYNIVMGHLRPFVDFGASLRHISTIKQTAFGVPGAIGGVITDNAMELHNRNSVGAVAGFGFTFKKGPFELTPEARYTRWANQSFLAAG